MAYNARRSTPVVRPKPTITCPKSSRDAAVLLTRIADQRTHDSTRIKELSDHLTKLQKQLDSINMEMQKANADIAAIKKKSDQDMINEKFLNKWKFELEENEKKNDETTRWKEYILKNEMPYDTFKFLDINGGVNCSLDTLTSDEIDKIGKYILASTIVEKNAYNGCSTYGELYEICDDENDHKIIGDVHRCFSDSDSENDGDSDEECNDYDCCHKRFARVLTELQYVNFDTTELVFHSRVD